MLNAIRVDFKRLLMTKSFVFLGLLIAVIAPIMQQLLFLGITKTMQEDVPVTMNDLTGYTSMAAIYLAVFVAAFLYAETGEGIVRNKIISGTKRSHILFSYCITNSLVAVILQVLSTISTVVVPVLVHSKFECNLQEIIRFVEISSLAGAAISVLYTVLFICFCTSKVSVAIPASVAILMKIILIIIMDALYTSSGVPKVTGSTLASYELFDRFWAFSHLTGMLRWDNASYLIGNIALIVISIIVGVIVFAKKNLK